jgi:O-acetyl-ADP-ribose deacetylase (regulator of RNase III)
MIPIRNEIQVGKMFIQAGVELDGPRWIINFPTKRNWWQPTKFEWVEDGLADLRKLILEKNIHSIALPPLGCGHGGLDWQKVRPLIEKMLGDLPNTKITVYEPTAKYQNVAKKTGVEKLTPARALIVEMIRRYDILGIECTLIEAQKLAWFLERSINRLGLQNPLDLRFEANRYGPYAHRLTHLLNGLDGSYLHCDKRLADAEPLDVIWFEETKREKVELYLRTEARDYLSALETADNLIDGFQSPLGMEVWATVDWLVFKMQALPTVESIRAGLLNWPAGEDAASRKLKLVEDKLISLALERLQRIGR